MAQTANSTVKAQENTAPVHPNSAQGHAANISGPATVIRADGTRAELKEGMPLYRGDQIEGNADVNIIFATGAAVALTGDFQVAIGDETAVTVDSGTVTLLSGSIDLNTPDGPVALTQPNASFALGQDTAGFQKPFVLEAAALNEYRPDAAAAQLNDIAPAGGAPDNGPGFSVPSFAPPSPFRVTETNLFQAPEVPEAKFQLAAAQFDPPKIETNDSERPAAIPEERNEPEAAAAEPPAGIAQPDVDGGDGSNALSGISGGSGSFSSSSGAVFNFSSQPADFYFGTVQTGSGDQGIIFDSSSTLVFLFGADISLEYPNTGPLIDGQPVSDATTPIIVGSEIAGDEVNSISDGYTIHADGSNGAQILIAEQVTVS